MDNVLKRLHCYCQLIRLPFDQVINQYSSYYLSDLATKLKAKMLQEPSLPSPSVIHWFNSLEKELTKEFNDVKLADILSQSGLFATDSHKVPEWEATSEKALADYRLVAQYLQHKDKAAFEKLYQDHKEIVHRVIRRCMGNHNHSDDIAQQVWLKMVENLHKFDPGRGNFGHFVYLWTKHYIMEFLGSKNSIMVEWEEEVLKELSASFAYQHDELRDHAEKLHKLMSIAFGGDSPPHQLIVFGFWLLEWKPEEIMEKLSNTHLQELESQLEDNYLAQSQLSEVWVRTWFEPLRKNMDKSFEKVVLHTNTRNIYTHLWNSVIGNTTLNDYYTHPDIKDKQKNLVQWRWAVVRRIIKEVLTQQNGGEK